MLSRPLQTRNRIRQVADGLLFAASLMGAYGLRAWFPLFDLPELMPVGAYLRMLPFVAVIAPVMLASQGFYEPPRPTTRLGTLFTILRSCTFTVMGLVLVLFVLREELARSVVILAGIVGGMLVYVRHEFSSWVDSKNFARGQLKRRVIWAGAADENRRLREVLSGAEKALLDESGDFDPAVQSDAELARLLHERAVNVVILNLAGVDRTAASRVLRICAQEGVEVLVRPGLYALAASRLTVDQFGGENVLYYRAQSAPPGWLVVKQIVDYVFGAGLIVLLAPIIGAVAAAIRLTSHGPVIYRQKRAGLNGRAFTMFKFRSMSVDAETRKAELEPLNEMRGPAFKMANDPRVTVLGRFLRRHSLDELPQLWNVVRGEMSLVGPRPLPVEEVGRFDDDTHRRRLSVKPGLTCLWQISGRNDIADFTDWVRLDLAYIDNWSLWLDLKILLATIPVALFGRGGK